jgi:vanillate O-demethylase monooxygenase subunit
VGETILSNIEPALRRTWLPVARSDAVDGTPARTWLLGEPLVLARVAGEVTVLEDRCPHRFAPLSAGKVVDGMIECAYHGWRYDGSGRCVEIPSLAEGAPVPRKARCGRPYAVTERYGLVFVALGEPLVELPEIPAFSEENRVRVDLTPFTGRYGAAQLIDNQLDVSHFAFLHRATFGSAQSRRPGAAPLQRESWGFSFSMSVPIRASNDPGVASGVRPLEQERMMRYRYRAPFFVELELEYTVMGGSNVILFFVQPETTDRATMYVTMLFKQPGGFTEDELAARVAFEYRVVGEDLTLQERFDELALPLDPTAECHVRADRPALEYRRLLADLVRAGAD